MSSDVEPICSISRRLVCHVLDATTLSILLIVQGSILNYYIISYYKTNVTGYFWFIGDFAALFIFAGALTISYQYFTHLEATSHGSTFYLSPKSFMCTKYPSSKLGILPLSYLSWLFYSSVLLSKIILIFKSEIPDNLNASEFFGTQLLQITIAASGVIFLLLAEGHSSANHHTLRYDYVTSTCFKTGIEILDSVNLLALLLVNETQMVLTFELENAVLFLCAFTFLLPALALYKLSLSEEVSEHIAIPLKVVYNLMHLLLLDVPFLAIRIYIWCYYHKSASLFLIKNVFGIIHVLRSLYPDIKAIVNKNKKSTENNRNNSNGYLPSPTEEHLELHDLTTAPSTESQTEKQE